MLSIFDRSEASGSPNPANSVPTRSESSDPEDSFFHNCFSEDLDDTLCFIDFAGAGSFFAGAINLFEGFGLKDFFDGDFGGDWMGDFVVFFGGDLDGDFDEDFDGDLDGDLMGM